MRNKFKNFYQLRRRIILFRYVTTPKAEVMGLAVSLSGNTLASINVVALRQTRLVLG